MKESTLKKILDLYKDGKISADEAEKMIGSKADAPGEQGQLAGRRQAADRRICRAKAAEGRRRPMPVA